MSTYQIFAIELSKFIKNNYFSSCLIIVGITEDSLPVRKCLYNNKSLLNSFTPLRGNEKIEELRQG